MGVAAADATRSSIVIAGIVGLVAGAMSMAAGEYVSVSSQADTEKADLIRERLHLAADPEFERQELAQIYVTRGLEPTLADKVAEQLMAHDALGAHARDELESMIRLHLAQIAGAHISIFGERFLCRAIILEVAEHAAWAIDFQLAWLARRQ